VRPDAERADTGGAPDLEEVVVLDYGGQYSQLIARRVRECGVFSELLPHHVGAQEVARHRPRGVILSGGPASVYEPEGPRLERELLELGIPVLGICYGMQLLAVELGGHVERAEVGEFGRSELLVSESGRLLAGTPSEQTCWMSHRDTVFSPPPGFTRLARSTASPVAAFESPERGVYGIQFHPEVVHTPYGPQVLTNFLEDVCGCERSWSASSVIQEQIDRIRSQLGEGRAICALSGGVDSSVAALLVHRAIGERLTCVFVDHGLMRKDEGAQVVTAFGDQFHVPLVAVDASTRFLARLKGVTDPEDKRKRIGAEFIRVFQEEAAKLEDVRFLVQGTLYSDVIESGGGAGAATIKSHHNVGGLPEDLGFQLVEPLRALFKDEVRAVGAELGLPERLVWRQPFPGPGLAIRIVGGEATRERLEVLREADAILQEEIRKAGLYRELWQSFCVLPDIRTVGVQGDSRTYGNVIVIRAVTSDDAMTADWARLPYDLLEQIASRMISEIPPVGRVVLDITSKPPGTIEWEVNQLVRTQGRAVRELFDAGDALREAHEQVMSGHGEGCTLRAAVERERAAVETLVTAARGLLSSEGHELSSSTIDRVADTLHAAALDDDARQQVQGGTLGRELRHVGLGLAATAGAPARRPPRRRSPGAAAESRERDRAKARKAAEAAESQARRRAERAARAVEDALKRRDRAAQTLEAAEEALASARAEAQAAASEHRRARERLRGT
jgi:GMP synthase (glutamine-hydrolysing)